MSQPNLNRQKTRLKNRVFFIWLLIFMVVAFCSGPLLWTKMTRLSPDNRLRTAADCLSRLRGLCPDLMSLLHGRLDRRE